MRPSWPKILVIGAAITIGVAIGVGGYTFIYAKGGSYMTDNPAACVNCHIMEPQYSGWMKGPHRAVATCNDCHTPASLIPKYLTKAENGWHHSYAFTTGDFHEPIQIKRRNRAITEQSCRKCHSQITATIEGHGQGELSCIRCHSNVGHL